MFDLIIQQAFLIDGTGKPGWTGDLAITNGKIAGLEPSINAEAARYINGKGLTLCPGFLDPHSHWDATHLHGKHGEIKLRQGVCLDVVGNCGESLTPCTIDNCGDIEQFFPGPDNRIIPRSFSQYCTELDAAQPGLRVMSHIGHGTLRLLAMGYSAEPPDHKQLTRMKEELRLALDQGAAGLSTGLYYTPSGFADSNELQALMEVVVLKEGFHASHIRNEASGILEALKEVITVGLKTGVATHISHLKLAGRNNWDKIDKVIETFETARNRGLDLTCDVYPYHHSCTSLLSLIPPWALEGGIDRFCERLNDIELKEQIRHQVRNGYPGWESGVQNSGFEGITISSVHSGKRQNLVGFSLAESADKAAMAPEDYVIDLIEKESGAVSIICASMDEEVVAEFIRLPFAVIGSDGALSQGKPHPRAFGAFPRVIRRFVRELKVLRLEEAIAKMTGKTAQRLGLDDCGRLSMGLRADLVLFNPETFGDTATYDTPCQPPVGIHHLFVEGKQAWPPTQGSKNVQGGFCPAPHSRM
ncbi:amidohydrolase family protein [Desulfopila sp. IMCC35008]|uniref:N-acyl-D-amino-acid deacylase family protein n=1 Tax=Desulfopila sp. IMCC35008 TaxID=2653858 RepID=UPI0013CF6FB7|nr:amidohydrolase family protein [Desulfopila sp. IMCC35008]